MYKAGVLLITLFLIIIVCVVAFIGGYTIVEYLMNEDTQSINLRIPENAIEKKLRIEECKSLGWVTIIGGDIYYHGNSDYYSGSTCILDECHELNKSRIVAYNNGQLPFGTTCPIGVIVEGKSKYEK